MNEHLENKSERYEAVTESECFKDGLIGLATIELNVTELCSRKCQFCPRFNSDVYKNQPLNMSVETVESLADELDSEMYEGDITIAGFGEPMLHPNLHSIVEIISNVSHTTLITNGDFLNEKTLKDLGDAGLDKVVVSCYDGPEQKEKFEQLLDKQSEVEFHLRELWGDFTTIVRENDFNSRTGLVPIISTGGGKCYLPFYKLFIDWNGDMVLCSNDWYRKENGLGNINEDNIRELWLGEKITKIRKNLSQGNRCGKACKDCHVNGTLLGQRSFDSICSTIGNT